jgi:hypothetical protein
LAGVEWAAAQSDHFAETSKRPITNSSSLGGSNFETDWELQENPATSPAASL